MTPEQRTRISMARDALDQWVRQAHQDGHPMAAIKAAMAAQLKEWTGE